MKGLSILRAGGRTGCNLRGSKVLANWALAAPEQLVALGEATRAYARSVAGRRLGECSGAVGQAALKLLGRQL